MKYSLHEIVECSKMQQINCFLSNEREHDNITHNLVLYHNTVLSFDELQTLKRVSDNSRTIYLFENLPDCIVICSTVDTSEGLESNDHCKVQKWRSCHCQHRRNLK